MRGGLVCVYHACNACVQKYCIEFDSEYAVRLVDASILYANRYTGGTRIGLGIWGVARLGVCSQIFQFHPNPALRRICTTTGRCKMGHRSDSEYAVAI